MKVSGNSEHIRDGVHGNPFILLQWKVNCSLPCWALAFQKLSQGPVLQETVHNHFYTCMMIWSKRMYKCSLTGEGPWGLDGTVGPLSPVEHRNFRGVPSINMSLLQSHFSPAIWLPAHSLPAGCEHAPVWSFALSVWAGALPKVNVQ